MVIDQDAANLASVQAGMNSSGYPGLWLGDQERRLRHFHKTISDFVGDCSSAGRSRVAGRMHTHRNGGSP